MLHLDLVCQYQLIVFRIFTQKTVSMLIHEALLPYLKYILCLNPRLRYISRLIAKDSVNDFKDSLFLVTGPLGVNYWGHPSPEAGEHDLCYPVEFV